MEEKRRKQDDPLPLGKKGENGTESEEKQDPLPAGEGKVSEEVIGEKLSVKKKAAKETDEPSASSVEEEEEKIPNYDHIFGEEQQSARKKTGILKKFAFANTKPLFWSTIIYFFQHLPVWVVPICTANLIDAVTAIAENGFSDDATLYLIVNAAVAFVSIVLNVPFTVLRWRIVSKMLRRTSAGLKSAVVRKLQHLSITYHKDMQSGKIQAKFLRDVESVDGLFNAIMFSLIPMIIGVTVSSAISLYKNLSYLFSFWLWFRATSFLRSRSEKE
ncbi:MAG: ABC transporter ATP-binding protein [Clostridia bacterium]|nr:ABC transporter ATP-binding protein [Clostridia bacterium]